MRFVRKILSCILYSLLYLLSLLPLRVHYFLSNIIFFFLFHCLRYRRYVVESNLKMAFPESSDDERAKIAREYYRYLSDIICEIVWSISKSPERMKKRGIFRVENQEILGETFDKYGNVVVLLAHTGNWELLSGLPGYLDDSSLDYDHVTVAYHAMSSPLSEELFKMLRKAHLKKQGNLVTAEQMLRFIFQHKEDKRLYFFISDQYPWKNGVVKTDFLGLPTLWVNGGEAVARKLNMPVVYLYIDRISRGRYIARVSMITEHPASTAPGEIMSVFSEKLEEDIIANKYNWLWSHKRWRNIIND